MRRRSGVGSRRSEWGPRAFAVLCIVVAGCSSAPEPVEDTELGVEECVSEEGQRFLTFCASKDAARLATRQHGIQEGDDGKGPENVVALPVQGAPVRGERDAPMTIHLFSDLFSGDSRAAYERLSAEVDGHPGEMRLVFRHAPVDENGDRAARAAIAADEQGKFWDFVDELYADGGIAPEEQWSQVAEAAGLELDRWERDRRSPFVDAVLEQDAIHAEDVGLVQAPTYFVNGVRKVGGVAIQEFDEVVEEEREYVEAMEDAGLSGADISWRRILQNYEPVDWEAVEEERRRMEAELNVAHIPVGASPQKGAPAEQSLVTVVVFADFQCGYCAKAAPEWMELVERYGEYGLRLVFKNYPLPMYEGSDRLAAAGMLAHGAGVFWEFFDAVYGGQVDVENLEAALRGLGWTGPDFEDAIGDDDVLAAVEADRRLGEDAGVVGTPTIFVNGIELVGVYTAGELAPLVEDQIALASSIEEMTGSRGEELYREAVEANRGH